MSAEYSYKLFKPIFAYRLTVWTLFPLACIYITGWEQYYLTLSILLFPSYYHFLSLGLQVIMAQYKIVLEFPSQKIPL